MSVVFYLLYPAAGSAAAGLGLFMVILFALLGHNCSAREYSCKYYGTPLPLSQLWANTADTESVAAIVVVLARTATADAQVPTARSAVRGA